MAHNYIVGFYLKHPNSSWSVSRTFNFNNVDIDLFAPKFVSAMDKVVQELAKEECLDLIENLDIVDASDEGVDMSIEISTPDVDYVAEFIDSSCIPLLQALKNLH